MNRRAFKEIVLVGTASFAVSGPAAEATPNPINKPDLQIQYLARTALDLKDGLQTVKLAKDKHGKPITTRVVDFAIASNSGTSANTQVVYVTGGKQGRQPLSLQISASSNGLGGSEDKVKIDYNLNCHTKKWEVHLDNMHSGQSSSPSPNSALGGPFWEENIHAVDNSKNPREERIFNEAYNLGQSIIHAASTDVPIGNIPRNQIPLN